MAALATHLTRKKKGSTGLPPDWFIVKEAEGMRELFGDVHCRCLQKPVARDKSLKSIRAGCGREFEEEQGIRLQFHAISVSLDSSGLWKKDGKVSKGP